MALRINPFFQMSVRSNMTSTRSPIPSSFPETLREVLNLRSQEAACPTEILTRLATFPFFHPSRSAAAQKMTNRFHHLAHASGPPKPSTPAHVPFRDQTSREHSRFTNTQSSQWRPTAGQKGSSSPGNRSPRTDSPRDGYRSRPGGSVPVRSFTPPADEGLSQQTWSTRKTTPSPNTTPNTTPRPNPEVATDLSELKEDKEAEVTNELITAPKFSSAAVKSSENTEDRILAKVKGKINKIGFSTYDATKVFMQQILDSDETEFLDEFMKFVFQKAATESTFCPLYAKLLHELADQFTHLRVVMVNLFRDYTAIFVEVETAPDVGTEDYKAFLEAQERKKFRRGYSQFVAELVKLGEADEDAFSVLVQQIVAVLEASYKTPAKTLVCEEYIDCLANMCMSAPKILSGASWSNGVKGRLKALTNVPKDVAPGLTNKGRFALMDLVDFANRGWKK